MKNFLGKNHIWINVVAGLLCVVMILCDASLASVLTPKDSDTYVKEIHEMEEFYADGEYDGNGSDFENKNKYTSIEGTPPGNPKYAKFNILEIVPERRMGYVGYMLEGAEPLINDTEVDYKAKRAYAMDAMVNNSPGTADYNQSQFYFHANFGNINTGSQPIVTREIASGGYDGYFLKVDSGEGVYALITGSVEQDSAGYVTNVGMTSIFKQAGTDYSHGSFDYVWVDYSVPVGETIPRTKASDVAGMGKGDKIYLTGYKKCKYVNNNFLLSMFCQPMTSDTVTKDDIRVFTRTAAEVAADPDLVDNVDIVFISASVDTAPNAAFKTYQKLRGINASDSDVQSFNFGKGTNDITFKQALTLYERVANKKDCSMVVSHALWNTSHLDRNYMKLIYMLYVVNRSDNNATDVAGSGRELFNNYLKSHRDDMPVIANVNGQDIKACDIIYIDESNGNIVINAEYSGNGFDYSGQIPNYYTRSGDLYYSESWPNGNFPDIWLMQYANNCPLNNYFKNDYVTSSGCDPLKQYWPKPLAQFENQIMHNDNGNTYRYGTETGMLGDLASSSVQINKKEADQSIIEGPGTGSVPDRIHYCTVNIKNGTSVNTVNAANPNKNIYINKYELLEEELNPATGMPIKDASGNIVYKVKDEIKNNFKFVFALKSTSPIETINVKVGATTYAFGYSGSTTQDTTQTSDPADMDQYLDYSYGSVPVSLSYKGEDTATEAYVATKVIAANPSYVEGTDFVVAKIHEYEGEVYLDPLDSDILKNMKMNTPITITAITKQEYNDSGTVKRLSGSDSITIVLRDFFLLN